MLPQASDKLASRHLTDGLALRPITRDDAPAILELVADAMSPTEGECAARTLEQHFASRERGIDDGRELFVLANGDSLIGITGLHRYLWGPTDHVWLSWFAVARPMQRRGIGTRMLAETEALAKSRGYSKLMVETYSTPGFAAARAFYHSRGFEQVGAIRSYLPGGGDMIVFSKQLFPHV